MEAEDNLPQWEKLPISAHREEIMSRIHDNDVVVISGETGCGKTTQVPKYILEERSDSRIIVTQPRRLAAMSVANRVAFELKCNLGSKVGYHIGMDCKANERTSITYVTNGIFLQKLTNDPNFLSSYTHFIFDEIHERGLECDFSLIAIKLYLCKRKNSKAKIILMSATLNSEMFSRFFAKTKLGQFVLARIIPEKEEKKRGRRGRGDFQQEEYEPGWKFKTELPITEDDYPAAKVELQTIRKYNIDIKYLEDVEQIKETRYGFSEEPDLDDYVFDTAYRAIEKYISQGDILIFVPGMREIRKMSDLLAELRSKYNVIELHSHYSETAYEQLFSKDPKAKIIISTNIAESSITLPDCRTVIDFCMTKQNFYDERTRFQRLELRWASKASLTQRAGRVGRVSNGTVIRLIPRSHLSNFNQYDSPEICRSPLEKTILQIKKLEYLDQMKKKGKEGFGSVFQNPYQVLSNAFEPPEVEAMNCALQRLVNEQALIEDKESMIDPEFNRMKYNGGSLKISRLGLFLVNMPCDLLIGKSLLLAIELGCVNEMLDVASIIYCKKPFFVSADKRLKSQQFIHTIIDYDRQNYNDFKLRHRLLRAWKEKFFEPWKKANWDKKQYGTRKTLEMISNDEEDENFYEIIDGHVINYTRMLNDFQKIKVKQQQRDWCTLRCVYANNLRQILVFREGLKSKLLKGKFNFRDIGLADKIKQLSLNICLFAAFKDSLMVIDRLKDDISGVNSFLNQDLKPQLSIDVDFSFKDNDKLIADYVYPEQGQRKIVRMGNTFLMESTIVILSKFMLPFRKKGRMYGNCNRVFRQLYEKQPFYPYQMRVKDLKNRTQVKVDNQSINGFIPHRGHHEGYLLSHGFFESKITVNTSCTCYLGSTETILLLMIFSPECELIPHASHQFYNRIKVNGYICKLPIFITEAIIHRIAELKEQIQKIFELDTGIVNEHLSTEFRAVMTDHYDEIPVVQTQWEDIHLEKNYKKIDITDTAVINGIKFSPLSDENDYHRKFDVWRRQSVTSFNTFHNRLKFESSYFICAGCYPNKLVTLCQLSSCKPKDKLFGYHQYNDCWLIEGKEIMCSERKHRIGKQINEDYVKIDSEDGLLIMHVDLSTEKFKYSTFNLDDLKKKQEQTINRTRAFRNRLDVFECMYCGEDTHNHTSKNLKDFLKHVRSKEHSRKITLFSEGLA